MKLFSCLSYSLFFFCFFRVFSFVWLFLPIVFLSLSFQALTLDEEEVTFELKRKTKSVKTKTKKQVPVPLRFKRQSFLYSEDFVIYNQKSKSHLKTGVVLKVHIPQTIAGFDKEFQIYGIVVYPIKAVLSGKIKAIKNTNKALITFDEINYNGETKTIETFPVFLEGSLQESLFKDIVLNFVESLPSIMALALKSNIPQTGIHFINTDFKNKVSGISNKQKEKNKSFKYLEINPPALLKVVVK